MRSHGRLVHTPARLRVRKTRGAPMVSSEDSAWDVPPSLFGTRAGGPHRPAPGARRPAAPVRESRGISAEQAAEAIRGSHSKISRMEHGRVGFKERDVADLLTLDGVTDSEERAALLNLAREANTPGWWHAYSDVLPTWVEPCTWAWRPWCPCCAPMRSSSSPACCRPRSTRGCHPPRRSVASEDEVDRRAELRVSRQEISAARARRSRGPLSTRARCVAPW